MAPWNGRAATSRRPTQGWIAGALGLTLLAGTAGSVQAGLLDALFGGARAYAPPTYSGPSPYGESYAPRYYDEDVPRSRRRSRGDRAPASDTNIEVPTVLQGATCCKNGEDPMRALLNDDTLMRGDVVMTPDGLRTFVGSRAPHAARDFQPVGKSTTISSTRRKELLALDR
ncbi:MAG: hypothetical protein JWO64_2600 [Hyphomicrobiales bacterium]|jgi:hypothetical protein|nr:hypothetical protein [Hyphomicrobiales bacterium]